MTVGDTRSEGDSEQAEHVDMLIVGAGISGVGGADHLTQQCPGLSFDILESQASFGGTWITHRFPGIRSDSDLYTFGYSFKPWTGAPIATAAEILKYKHDVSGLLPPRPGLHAGVAGHGRFPGPDRPPPDLARSL